MRPGRDWTASLNSGEGLYRCDSKESMRPAGLCLPGRLRKPASKANELVRQALLVDPSHPAAQKVKDELEAGCSF